MALSHSPKTVTDGLVFMYDTGNKKSYVGEPTTNLLNYTTEFNSWTAAKNSGTTPTVTADTSVNPLGFANEPMADKVYLPDDGTYPRVQQYFTPSSTSTHTFSVWIRSISGNCDCFLGAFRNSPWSLPGSSVKSITGEWQRFTFSWTPPDTTTHVIYMGSHDTAAQKGNTLEFWGAQMEAKSHTTQFVNGTRSATAGLIDRTGNSTIDLSPASYDSNAQITFDGTDDYITLGSDSVLQNIGSHATIECWFKSSAAGAKFALMVGWGDGTSYYSNFGIGNWYSAQSDESIYVGVNSAAVIYAENDGSTKYHDGNWHHAVALIGHNNHKIYVDGSEVSVSFPYGSNTVSTSKLFGFTSGTEVYIGLRPYGNGHFQGELPVVKIYDRLLSDDEILQNYNATKSRFGL